MADRRRPRWLRRGGRNKQATTPEPWSGVQGEGGADCGGRGKTRAELARQFDVHPNLINQWRARLLEGATEGFGAEPAAAEPAVDVKVLHAGTDELALANDFWPARSRSLS